MREILGRRGRGAIPGTDISAAFLEGRRDDVMTYDQPLVVSDPFFGGSASRLLYLALSATHLLDIPGFPFPL